MINEPKVYITSTGQFLPGEPVSNSEIEQVLGKINGNPSRLRALMLRKNRIKKRHYAIDPEGRTLFHNDEMAVEAINNALEGTETLLKDISFLSAASSQGDLMAPGFASAVQGRLETQEMEISNLNGVCSSGVMALKNAYWAIKTEEHKKALSCASEFPSRFFHSEFLKPMAKEDGEISSDVEFLRWMLSDGAGAFVLENRPNQHGLSFRVDWIDMKSYAGRYPTCMYAGGVKDHDKGEVSKYWYEYANPVEAAKDGAITLRQDLELLEEIVPLGVRRYFELIDLKKIDPSKMDWVLFHYSSHYFREKVTELLKNTGGYIPEEKWFTNLYEKGNTGCASIYIMLDDLLKTKDLQAGQQILCMVPESARFNVCFFQLTVVDGKEQDSKSLESKTSSSSSTPLVEETALSSKDILRNLSEVWLKFQTEIRQVPFIKRIENHTLRLEDYQELLCNMRQQVMEGGRWIARAGSNIEIEYFDMRSLFLQHSVEEHKDFRLLEDNYVATGGQREVIQNYPKNIGSEALSAWMFHQANQSNPFDLIGAMFIIEGLGKNLALKWGQDIATQLNLPDEAVSFLLYHGNNDEDHFEKIHIALDWLKPDAKLANQIIKTAKVTAELYLLQLKKIGEF